MIYLNKLFVKGLNLLGMLTHFNIQTKKSIFSKKFKIPILQKVGYSNLYLTECWMLKLIHILIKIDNNKFIDVGANVGQTLLKLRALDKRIEYIGFEPNTKCVDYIRSLIQLNNLNRSTILPIGLSDVTQIGELQFTNLLLDDSSASIIEGLRPDTIICKKHLVPLYNLKDLSKTINVDNPSVIKIDVEGAELEVLKSFESVINKFQPFIIIEILPVYGIKYSDRLRRQRKIEELCKEWNYVIMRLVIENGILRDFKLINEIGIHSDLNQCDYLFVPRNKRKILVKLINQMIHREENK